MRKIFRSAYPWCALLATAAVGATFLLPGSLPMASGAVTPPPTPKDLKVDANYNSSITVTWKASPGAASYDIYRATTSGGEGNTPYATTTNTHFNDPHLSNSPVYFYEVSAVNSSGQSARTPEDASKTPPPPVTGGTTPGVRSGNSWVFYCEDAQLAGFDWFEALTGWFPQVLGQPGSNSPGQQVVDMAYSTDGTLTFKNVRVPSSGLYTVDWRYAFQGGLFPAVNDRQMGLEVNGQVITRTERFPITGSFGTFEDSFLQVHLNAGVNSISMLAVSDHGVSRVDEMTVTPATASIPSAPTNLQKKGGNGKVTLTWTASRQGAPTSYSIYRGTNAEGEAITPIATVNGTTTTFTDTGLTNGTRYFYQVAANNAVGISPDSNEVAATPSAG
ncbi:MAG TPA: fibronectin type III domain-containing protein [Streptosporangiaceae bacterium]|nr:fibronectin type III domain-containing protein [Streptosporangiaceae bacterium]